MGLGHVPGRGRTPTVVLAREFPEREAFRNPKDPNKNYKSYKSYLGNLSHGNPALIIL
jgi:hypothetical protein